MSDKNSLTPDELNALMSEGDDGASNLAPVQTTTTANDAAFEAKVVETVAGKLQVLQEFLGKAISAPQTNYSMLASVDILNKVGTSYVRLASDFSGAASGTVQYLMSRDNAQKLVALVMGQEQEDLDDASLPALNEALSTFLSNFLTQIGSQVSLTPAPMNATLEEGAGALSLSEYKTTSYSFTVEDLDEAVEILELWEPNVTATISNLLSPPPPPPQAAAAPNQASGGMGQGNGNANGITPVTQTVQFSELNPLLNGETPQNINLLMDVSVELSVELGRTRWKIRDILSIGEGTIIELDKLNGEPVDVLVNKRLIAKGEVVIIDESFGVRITEIVTPLEQLGYGVLE